MNIRKFCSTVVVTKHQKGLPREVEEPPLETFKACLEPFSCYLL